MPRLQAIAAQRLRQLGLATAYGRLDQRQFDDVTLCTDCRSGIASR
jgi:hypothetical protein